MFKLVALLGVGMFLAMMVMGEDKGQVRQGLVGVDPAASKVLRAPQVKQTARTEAPATLTNFTPVTVQKNQHNGQAPITGSFVLTKLERPASQPAPQPVSARPDSGALPVMYINASAVNVRGGPSTDYGVVGRLTRDEAVAVVSPPQNGWVQIRIEGDGVDGFIAARLLTDIDPLD